jgi:ubiquinone/menaquinone biosynthesis C-methylase UbiE
MYHSGTHVVDPHALVKKLQLSRGMHVADFGCGRTGHLVFPFAHHVGEHGMVYAVDILRDVLENIDKRAAHDAVSHIHTVWSDIEKPGATAIPESSLDAVCILNTLFQTDNQWQVLEEARRLLKPKARIMVGDWERHDAPYAPHRDLHIDFDDIAYWARANDFAVQDDYKLGPYHRGMILFRHV